MDDLQLFSVTVTQTWSAKADCLVLAPSLAIARNAARSEVKIDRWDSEEEDKDTYGQAVNFEVLNDTRPESDIFFLVRGKGDGYDIVEQEYFIRQISPERLEALRLARIERDNGQLVLDLSTDATTQDVPQNP